MNSNLAPKPFSTSELVAGSAALAPIALIALFGLQAPQSQNPLPDVPSGLSSASIPSSKFVGRASGEQLNEESQNTSTARNPPPIDPGSEGDKLISPEPASQRATGSAAPDRPLIAAMLGRSRFDDSPGAEQRAAAAPPLPLEQSPPSRRGAGEGAFVGGWADDTDECRQYQNHGAPLFISAHAAKTASGECDFRFIRREAASRWRIVALCSREGESWTAHVDLTLVGSSLTWSSERGAARYVRCQRP